MRNIPTTTTGQSRARIAYRVFAASLMLTASSGLGFAQDQKSQQPSPAATAAPMVVPAGQTSSIRPAASPAPAGAVPSASNAGATSPAATAAASSSVPAPTSDADSTPVALDATAQNGDAVTPSTPAPSAAASVLPRDLSPWGMFLQADIIVKAVMIGLAFASLVTWTIWFAKGMELAAARRRARSAVRKLARADNLEAARVEIATGWTGKGTVADLVGAAEREVRRSNDLSSEGIKERLAIALSRIEAKAGRDIARGTGLLATIGATAPFVGLFGTVWGIMNSFIGISQSKTTNLAVVAPGIAEALLATALGLVAAIPAVIIYNVFARALVSYRALLSDASGEIIQHISRDLERQERGLAPRSSGLSLAHDRTAAE